MVTLKDIARECQVSFSTVSKALKHSSEISEETIKLVEEKAKEMGYHPNVAARTLRTNRTFDIGLIFEDKTGSGLQHQYFAKITSGIQKEAQNRGYEITFISHPDTDTYNYYSHIRARNFDGVAILSAYFEDEQIQELIKSDIPTVTLDYKFDEEHLSVMSDNKQGMRELTEFVLSQGHKKIAMIHGENTVVTKERIDEFTATCAENGIDIPEEYFLEALYHDPVTSAEATNVLMDLPDPPTCIIYPDDYSALGGIRELNAQNLKAGLDISIVGYDGIMLTSMMIPPLSTYEQDGERIGRVMAEMLIDKIEKKEVEEPCRLIGGRLLAGGTVAYIEE